MSNGLNLFKNYWCNYEKMYVIKKYHCANDFSFCDRKYEFFGIGKKLILGLWFSVVSFLFSLISFILI